MFDIDLPAPIFFALINGILQVILLIINQRKEDTWDPKHRQFLIAGDALFYCILRLLLLDMVFESRLLF